MGFITATADWLALAKVPEFLSLIRAFASSGFRRFSTYRQATVAATVTNTMFGFLRTYVMLAIAAVAAGGVVAGYSGPKLATYVWAGQGLIGVVLLWGWTDLADRIRSGDVVVDLLRPVSPVIGYLATDMGRAGYAMLTRFSIPMIVGALAFDLYAPQEWLTYPLFLVSVVLAVIVCFGCRYLVNSVAYWLLDNRGASMAWVFMSGMVGGLYFPIRFLPDWLAALVWFGTPGPSLFQAPLDVLVERDPMPMRLGMIGVQLVWAIVLLGLCNVVQRRAERRLVIQGG